MKKKVFKPSFHLFYNTNEGEKTNPHYLLHPFVTDGKNGPSTCRHVLSTYSFFLPAVYFMLILLSNGLCFCGNLRSPNQRISGEWREKLKQDLFKWIQIKQLQLSVGREF